MQDKKIKEIVNKIKEKFNPQKIILFGSYAWGRPTEDSDIDLFIVMKSDLRRDERANNILSLFSDRLFAMDVLVYTPLKLSIKRGNLFIKEILDKGKVLYG